MFASHVRSLATKRIAPDNHPRDPLRAKHTPSILGAPAGKVLVASRPKELNTRSSWRVPLSLHGSVRVEDVRSNEPVEALPLAATVAGDPESAQNLPRIYPERS